VLTAEAVGHLLERVVEAVAAAAVAVRSLLLLVELEEEEEEVVVVVGMESRLPAEQGAVVLEAGEELVSLVWMAGKGALGDLAEVW
jgi:hypothetical protein